MTDTSFQFMMNYLKAFSPTGYEKEGQKIWLDYMRPMVDDYQVDAYGSVAAIINPGADYKVVIEAHADEIAWYVNYITDQGYIYLRRNGGSDALIAPSKKVNIFGSKGVVKAVFGWPAIHVRKVENDKAPTIDTVFLDCGAASKQEVEEMGIHVGCMAVFEDEPFIMNEKYLVGRALDNRIGGFMIAETTRMIRENNIKLPYSLYIVNAVQEEIGLRGAEMMAHRINPDVALVTDVTHDTQSPMYEKKSSGDLFCGKGPVITYGPPVQNGVREMVIEAAQRSNIPFQRAAATRSTGTDTDAFAYSGMGVASALVSLPLKYMHTTVETVHLEDIENVSKLMYEFLVNLPSGHDFRYIK